MTLVIHHIFYVFQPSNVLYHRQLIYLSDRQYMYNFIIHSVQCQIYDLQRVGRLFAIRVCAAERMALIRVVNLTFSENVILIKR